MPQLRIDGMTVDYSLEGPPGAPALVFAHALSLNRRSWDAQRIAFRSRFRVMCYDLRGHGGSEDDGRPYQIEELARDAVALFDRLEIGRAHFVGSSLGGMAGLVLAFEHAERLASLTLVATQGTLPASAADRLRANVTAMQASGTTMASGADAMLARLLYGGFAQEKPEAFAALRASIAANSIDGHARACEAIAAMSLDDRLHTIRMPVLVVAGERDPATSPERMTLYRDSIPGARMVTIEGAGHFPHAERPDAFNAVLATFLERLS